MSQIKTDTDLLFKRPLIELIPQANEIRSHFLGNKIELCSITNAKSGLCSEDCKFCAQSRRYASSISTYPLKSKLEIFRAAEQAQQIGAERFGIVTSGNRLSAKEVASIVQAIEKIKNNLKIKPCASLGALDKDSLLALKQAGLTRYHHNIESSPRFFRQIVSTHSFEERINTIKAAQQVGLEVCSGGIIGMGEDWQDRMEMAEILQDLNVDSVPINLLVPVQGTPLASLTPVSCTEAIRTLCIFRIILKDKIIKIAAGRESILGDFQGLGFMAGANGMLIGGYLTLKGRALQDDYKLVKEIARLWAE